MPSTPVYSTAKPQAKLTVGTSAVQLNDVSSREVWITCDDANSGKVFVGDSSVTTTGGGNVFTKLQAGGVMICQISNPKMLYVVGSAASQIVYLGVFD